jgi:anti-sigma regulatory factor (Ser/Thr protein kinase)
MTTQAAEPVTWYQRTFHGRADQVSQVRRQLASWLADHPATDDAVLIARELAANAAIHSASVGEFFTIRVETYPTYVWVECEDLGGPWHRKPGDGRPHGLDIIQALAGSDNWGTETTSDGGRIVWTRLDLSPDPSPPDGGGHMPGPHASTGPGTGIGPDIEEVRGTLEYARHLRMALDLLEENLPPAYACDGLLAELWALREKIDAAELARLRNLGQREYLVIQPLAPAAAMPLITRAAQAIKILDDLGLVIRLV